MKNKQFEGGGSFRRMDYSLWRSCNRREHEQIRNEDKRKQTKCGRTVPKIRQHVKWERECVWLMMGASKILITVNCRKNSVQSEFTAGSDRRLHEDTPGNKPYCNRLWFRQSRVDRKIKQCLKLSQTANRTFQMIYCKGCGRSKQADCLPDRRFDRIFGAPGRMAVTRRRTNGDVTVSSNWKQFSFTNGGVVRYSWKCLKCFTF